MKTKLMILGIIISAGIFGCKKESPKPLVFDNFSILYQVGFSPTNYLYEVVIDNTGLMQITSSVKEFNNQSNYHLTDADLALVKEKLGEVTTINFEKCYIGNIDAYDLPGSFIKYSVDGKKDSTSMHNVNQNQLPDKLAALLTTIGNLVEANDTVNYSMGK
ncbi:MAG TPA: hypothetical protein VMV56_09300 [Williamwhitmania sp.]|nr:hypothetical protein [Williamwhitmania sp.]